MEIKSSGSQPSAKGPAEWFTGTVRVDPLFDTSHPARVAGASVRLNPARAPRGTPTRSGRPRSSHPGPDERSVGGGPIENIRPRDDAAAPRVTAASTECAARTL